MSQGQRRTHGWLSRLQGESGEPFLPQVGELYLINTRICFGFDPAADRPAVVLCVPPDRTSRSPIQLVTRTSQPVSGGVTHPADKALQLDRDGTFSDLVSVEQQLWRSPNVRLLGLLPEPYLSLVVRRFS
jgi:hypothetical protein